MATVTVYRAQYNGHTCHFGERSVAKAWAGRKGAVEEIQMVVPPDLKLVGEIEKDDSLAARDIECQFAGRMAIMLELMLLDPVRHWDECAKLLGDYRAAWDDLYPMPNILGMP